MSEFKELIFKLREDPDKIEKIYEYVKTDPVTLSKMPDDTYVISDGNHRANLLNLLKVDKVPSIIDGEYKLVPIELLRRPNGTIGTQGFTSENMINLINYILNKKPKKSLFEELIEDKELDKKIIKSFRSKDTLCPDIFNKRSEGYSIRDDVRKKLIEISDNFIESFGVEFFIHDIILTGSLSNYNWSEYSDVDLHILIDMDELDGDDKMDSTALHTIMKEFFDAKKNIWNEKHNVKVKGFDVEVYVQDVDEEHVSSGVYSILYNKCVVETEKNNQKIDDRKIIEKGEDFAKKIDDITKIDDPKDIIKKIETIRKKLKKFRQSGLESGGEYSYENLTFKLLRRNGYIEKLLNLKNDIIDKKLSLSNQ